MEGTCREAQPALSVCGCTDDEEATPLTEGYTQYSESGGLCRPLGRTVKILSPGLYYFNYDSIGLYINNITINNGELIKFAGTLEEKLIDEFEQFWKLKDAYLARGEQHKRGYLLHGPPGSGKSSLVAMLMTSFIKQGNVVFEFGDFLVQGMRTFREIEPDRKAMVIIEDVDSYVGKEEENQLLQFLDGAVQQTNTVVIATTNYPERLPGRIRNRPSRFDRVEKIDYPSEEARRFYAESKCKTMTKEQIDRMVQDTKGFTFAHIKELILAVEVYMVNYDETLDRLLAMKKQEDDSMQYDRSDTKYGIR